MMLQTVGPGYQGGMMMDGSAKIAQDTRERQIVSVANVLTFWLVFLRVWYLPNLMLLPFILQKRSATCHFSTRASPS